MTVIVVLSEIFRMEDYNLYNCGFSCSYWMGSLLQFLHYGNERTICREGGVYKAKIYRVPWSCKGGSLLSTSIVIIICDLSLQMTQTYWLRIQSKYVMLRQETELTWMQHAHTTNREKTTDDVGGGRGVHKSLWYYSDGGLRSTTNDWWWLFRALTCKPLYYFA